MQAVAALKKSCLAKDLLRAGMKHEGEDGRDGNEEGSVVRLSSAGLGGHKRHVFSTTTWSVVIIVPSEGGWCQLRPTLDSHHM